MGHHQLEAMARTGAYHQVVSLLGVSAGAGWRRTTDPGTLAQVADATLSASLDGLLRAKGDEGLGDCLYLLAAVVRSAQADDFGAALTGIGVADVSATPSVGWGDVTVAPAATNEEPYTSWELVCGFSEAIERRMGDVRCRTDLGEMAQLAAAESLNALCEDKAESLYGSSSLTVRSSLRGLSTELGFGRLAHEFFARLTSRYLQYHLSRELSNHVGSGRRFATVDDHNGFLTALDRHCRVTARHLRTYSAEWFGKLSFLDDWSPERARGFTAHAVDKLRDALRHQEGQRVVKK